MKNKEAPKVVVLIQEGQLQIIESTHPINVLIVEPEAEEEVGRERTYQSIIPHPNRVILYEENREEEIDNEKNPFDNQIK